MRRRTWTAWTAVTTAAAATLVAGGCATGPLLDNPVKLQPLEWETPVAAGDCVENPVYVPQGPQAYAGVFEKIIDILTVYFEISYANRYDGRIITFPRTTPGFERPLAPGAPELDFRLLATLQSIRQRAEIEIQPADDGGFFVDVKVYKELEDLPRPVRATAAASFRTDNGVERQFEVIDPTVPEGGWIPLGRDTALEQIILQKIKKCL